MSCIKNVALVEPLVDVVDPKQVNCTHAKLKTFNIEKGNNIAALYRDGSHMVAIIFMTGTKYACNERNYWDQICMQSRLERGLNMLAISNLNRTIYACNLFQ